MINSPDVLKSTVDHMREARSLGVDVDVNFHRPFHEEMPVTCHLAALLEKEGILFIESKSQTTGFRELAIIMILGCGEYKTSPPNLPIRAYGPRALHLHPRCRWRTSDLRHNFKPFFEGGPLDNQTCMCMVQYKSVLTYLTYVSDGCAQEKVFTSHEGPRKGQGILIKRIISRSF